MKSYKLSEPYDHENDREYALNNPISFWEEVSDKYIHWDKKYEKVYSGDEMYPQWYKGGKLNTCFNILDIHLKDPTKMNKDAIIYECPFLNKTVKITYSELYQRVCEFSRVLLDLNVTKDDNVLIYMANTIEGLIGALACTRIGATHCILVEGISVKSLIERIEEFTPKVILLSNFNITNNQIVFSATNLSIAIEESSFKPDYTITLNRKDEKVINSYDNIPSVANSLDWETECLKASLNPYYEYTSVDSTHPLYVIYTSGTTGNAKAVVRDNASHLAAYKYYWNCMISPYKCPTYLTYSSFGWIAFHIWFYSIMACGGTLVIFEGGIIQDNDVSESMWQTIQEHKVNFMFAVPRSFRYLIKYDPEASFVSKYDLSSLKSIWLCGEVVEKQIKDYIEDKLKINSSTCYGQTETGHTLIFDLKPSDNVYKSSPKSTGVPLPFVNLSILSEDGKELGNNENGHLAFKLPAPPGFLVSLYNNKEKFKLLMSKVKGYYLTGDMAFKSESGYFGIVSRSDDVLLINGNKIELSRIEESVLKHSLVTECNCIGISNQLTGHAPIGLVILKKQIKNTYNITQLKNEINSIISNDIEPYSILKSLLVVYDLPRTKNGKSLKGTLTSIINDQNFIIPTTSEDYKLLNEIQHLYNSNQSFETYELKRIT